jgi:multidrug resistance efflux pump
MTLRPPSAFHALAALCVAVCGACSGGNGAALDPALIHTVARGDLIITVRERGEIKAAHNTRVTSEVEGRATLIKLVPEGTVVQAGDVVAELDTSALAEKRATEEISVAKADAGVLQARKAVEIMEKELRAAESARESELEIARLRERKLLGQPRQAVPGAAEDGSSDGTNGQVLDELRAVLADEGSERAESAEVVTTPLGNAATMRTARAVKPVSDDLVARIIALFEGEQSLALQMGDMGNQILKQVSEINLSRADLELATETLRYSEQLSAEGFLSRGELNQQGIFRRACGTWRSRKQHEENDTAT